MAGGCSSTAIHVLMSVVLLDIKDSIITQSEYLLNIILKYS